MTKRIINEEKLVEFMDSINWVPELHYMQRPGFKRILNDAKKKRIDCIVMPRVYDLSQNPNDVIEACKMLKGMGIKVIFEKDNLTLDDVLNLDIFTLARLTIETVKGDALVVIHSEKTYNEIMNG